MWRKFFNDIYFSSERNINNFSIKSLFAKGAGRPDEDKAHVIAGKKLCRSLGHSASWLSSAWAITLTEAVEVHEVIAYKCLVDWTEIRVS